jgi:hypothetical protein
MSNRRNRLARQAAGETAVGQARREVQILPSSLVLTALALVASCAGAQTVHTFSGGADGAFPVAGLAAGKNGVFYGTTVAGGTSALCEVTNGCGTVFQLTPPASPGGSWTETPIYTFPSSAGGDGYLLSNPAVGPHGEIYGTAYFGGTDSAGSVFELTPPSTPGGAWTETDLYSFSVAQGAPQNPVSGVVIGDNGVLYGTVQFAGTSANCPFPFGTYGCGAVYSLTPPASTGQAWTEQTLYTFQGGADGAVPLAGVAIGSRGELYGTTYAGGAGSLCVGNNIPHPGYGVQSTGCGAVFELDPPSAAGGEWAEQVLYSFLGGSDGGYPNAVSSRNGKLYGTATFGGDPRNCGGVGCGGVFELNPPAAAGGAWTESVIYSFASVPDGLFPGAGIVIGEDGTIFGTTRDGGDPTNCPANSGCGTIFQLSPPPFPGFPWRESVLHRFSGLDGSLPQGAPAIGWDGALYVTASAGGPSAACACGTIVRVNPQHWPEVTYRPQADHTGVGFTAQPGRAK